jgi:hypothetical protein
MKKARYSEEQIIAVLKQMEAGRKVGDLARELGERSGTHAERLPTFTGPQTLLPASHFDWKYRP